MPIHCPSHVPWDDGNLVRIVGSLEKVVEVPHHTLKRITHEVQRPVGVND